VGYCLNANPYPVPTPSRWHPSPTAADADSGGEDYCDIATLREKI